MNRWPIALLAMLLLFVCPVAAGEINGVVLGHNGKPVPHATVVLCDQDSGIPVSKFTFKPFTKNKLDLQSVVVVTTDVSGMFHIKNALDGEYRLLAQSWSGTTAIKEVFKDNGKNIILRGVEDGILVPSEKAMNVEIKPLGRCEVILNEDFPNSDALLLVSIEPLSVDPVLGFVCWQGPFLQNLIGANRMPYGFTKISGLPEGKIYLSVFANDSAGGIGAGMVEAKAGETVQAEYIPIVCTWSNGRHDPPKELEATFEEIKREKDNLRPYFKKLCDQWGIVAERNEKAKNPLSAFYPHLNQIVTLPSGRKVRFADVLASLSYIDLQDKIKRRNRESEQQDTSDD